MCVRTCVLNVYCIVLYYIIPSYIYSTLSLSDSDFPISCTRYHTRDIVGPCVREGSDTRGIIALCVQEGRYFLQFLRFQFSLFLALFCSLFCTPFNYPPVPPLRLPCRTHLLSCRTRCLYLLMPDPWPDRPSCLLLPDPRSCLRLPLYRA